MAVEERALDPSLEQSLDLSTRRSVHALLLSDTHGYLDPRVLALGEGAALAVHGGDVGSRAVLDALAGVCDDVVAVFGNNDVAAKWPAAERDILTTLPRLWRIALPGGALVVEHGHEAGPLKVRHARLRKRYPDARAIVVGHSHLLALDDERAPWVLNPGAAGAERTHGGPSALVLRASRRSWRVEVARFARTPRPRPR